MIDAAELVSVFRRGYCRCGSQKLFGEPFCDGCRKLIPPHMLRPLVGAMRNVVGGAPGAVTQLCKAYDSCVRCVIIRRAKPVTEANREERYQRTEERRKKWR